MAPERLQEIGQRIRRLRQAAELTLRELAERADLTPGYISQLERGKVSISIDSLMMLLDALNVPIANFFRPSRERIVFREEDAMLLEREGVDEFAALVPGGANRVMEPVRVRLQPGESVTLKPFSGEQYGYLLRGRVAITYINNTSRASKGQSFYAGGEGEITIQNPGKSEAVFIWITSPPYF